MHRHVRAAALVLAGAMTYGTGTATAATGPPVSGRDRAWLVTAHETGLAEVEAGDLAQRKGVTPAVRAAGAMLVTDHTRLDAEVVRLARTLRVNLPGAADPHNAEAIDRFANDTGSAFDYDFAFTMVLGHQDMIGVTQAEIGQGSSPQVTALARKALPVLRKHLTTLRQAAATG